MINICTEYAKEWRFNFGLKKTKCLQTGPDLFSTEPVFTLNGNDIDNVRTLNILGTVFNRRGSSCDHVDTRIQKCRQSFHALASSGMSHPGISTEAKVHLWKTVCSPTLTYGLDCFTLSKRCQSRVDSVQGTLVKSCLGIGKRSHHSDILSALQIPKVSKCIDYNVQSLYHRIFKVASPVRTLCCHLLSKYIVSGEVVKGTIVGRIINTGVSPVLCMQTYTPDKGRSQDDGVVDSLRHLLYHENYCTPGSNEHILAKLITRSF